MNPARSTARVEVVRYDDAGARRCRDSVASEEPLEIRLRWIREGRARVHPVAVTMRTPGSDAELAVGFLFSEGVLRAPHAVAEVAHCAGGGPQNLNVVEVRLRGGTPVDESLFDRRFAVGSSCGVCGKASIDGVVERLPRALSPGPRLSSAALRALPARLRTAQALFDRTGGLHGAALFDGDGELLVCREDVGRHNAVDKVVGRALLDDALPLAGRVLVVSGRTSFEILQKAFAAGVAFVVGVGAPSSLAVSLARRSGGTLVGFAGEAGFNVYAGEERLG